MSLEKQGGGQRWRTSPDERPQEHSEAHPNCRACVVDVGCQVHTKTDRRRKIKNVHKIAVYIVLPLMECSYFRHSTEATLMISSHTLQRRTDTSPAGRAAVRYTGQSVRLE